MRTVYPAIASMLAALLTGCQSLDHDRLAALQVSPVQDVRHGISRPEAQYAIGRYLQGQQRHEEAIAAYRRLLETHPHHAAARNALGLALAAQGRHEQAIAEFAAAVAAAPNAVAIRNNLGYAQLLQGNVTQAIATLEEAQALDPHNRRVQDNLNIARAGSTAGTPRDSSAAPAARPRIDRTPTMPFVPAHDAARLVHVSANVMAIVGRPARPTQPAAAPSGEAAPTSAARPRLEISNANGITGLARDTANQLAAAGYARPRLTNQPPYQLPATEIQYRPGFEPQARQLREQLQVALRGAVPLAPSIPLAPSTVLRQDVQLRLVLGKDVLLGQDVNRLGQR